MDEQVAEHGRAGVARVLEAYAEFLICFRRNDGPFLILPAYALDGVFIVFESAPRAVRAQEAGNQAGPEWRLSGGYGHGVYPAAYHEYVARRAFGRDGLTLRGRAGCAVAVNSGSISAETGRQPCFRMGHYAVQCIGADAFGDIHAMSFLVSPIYVFIIPLKKGCERTKILPQPLLWDTRITCRIRRWGNQIYYSSIGRTWHIMRITEHLLGYQETKWKRIPSL